MDARAAAALLVAAASGSEAVLASDLAPSLLHDAMRDSLACLRGAPEQARLCAEVLVILDEQGCDEQTGAAMLRYAAWDVAPRSARAEVLARVPAGERPLVDGQMAAQRVWTLHAQGSASDGAEGLRRMLLAIIGDLRVVFIALAWQLARLRAARTAPTAQRRALAELTRDIHAPLANRLGIWRLKWDLEDLAFATLQPDTYHRIAQLLDERRDDREAFVARCIDRLGTALASAGIAADLAGRPKHIYSIWRKMQRKHLAFAEIYDIHALRVLVDDIPTCYAALGVVHGLWPHIPQEFDDYLARPKPNGYQSLHTAVVGPDGKTVEVQIRTHDMHAANELGVAAHWRYKEGGSGDSNFEAKVAWMRRLLDAHGDDGASDDVALADGFRTDLLEDRVYLLTPRGAVIDLPRGATVLDFAYHVHTDVGHRCRGAKVNGRIVPLTFQPHSGDRVEVLTGKAVEPSRDWLSAQQGYLNSTRARAKVRAWFHHRDRAANLAAGRSLLERELRRVGLSNSEPENLARLLKLKTHDELLLALALGDVTSGQIARVLQESQQPAPAPPPPAAPRAAPPGGDGALTIDGVGNLATVLARCCQPLPGDAVRGFITRGRGVSVHRADCPALARLRRRDADRVVDVQWSAVPAQAWLVDVVVRGYDRRGLQKDVTTLISNSDARIVASSSRVLERSAEVEMHFTLRVADYAQLSALLGRVEALPNVLDARRLRAS